MKAPFAWLGVFCAFAAHSGVFAASLPKATYVGAKVCGSCHVDKYQLWSKAIHSRMIQDVSPASVLGDFKVNNTLTHGRSNYRMFIQNGQYFIWEQEAGSPAVLHKIAYTLGSKRVQHYLAKLPDGRIRVTFPTWDSRAQKWFHSTEIVRTSDYAEVPVQLWNKHCFNCHATNEQQNFNIGTNTYQTTWTNHGTACEACHGPGSLHVARYRDKTFKAGASENIVFPRHLDKERKMQVCTQCHQPRIIVKTGYESGKNYFDYYLPTLMHFYIDRVYDPPMWADGRMRRFATEGLALMQSKCYIKGDATCITCHNPHLNTIAEDPLLGRNDNALCTKCHPALAQNLTAHTRHQARSTGSQCVTCHMPYITGMLKDYERDHTISIPTPETTVRFGIPNACNECHTNRTPDWAVRSADLLWPGRPKPNLRRAEAFSLSMKRDPAAIDKLIALLEDRSEGTTVRGSAAGFLGEYKGERVSQALVGALKDTDVVVRAEAVRSLGEVRGASTVMPLAALLQDANGVVRILSAFSLIKMGVTRLEGSYGSAYEKASREYLEFLESFADLERNQINMGTFLALNEQFPGALQAFRNAVKLNPDLPEAHYYVGVTHARMEQWDEALKAFNRVLRLEPNYRNTRELIEKVHAIQSSAARPAQSHP